MKSLCLITTEGEFPIASTAQFAKDCWLARWSALPVQGRKCRRSESVQQQMGL